MIRRMKTKCCFVTCAIVGESHTLDISLRITFYNLKNINSLISISLRRQILCIRVAIFQSITIICLQFRFLVTKFLINVTQYCMFRYHIYCVGLRRVPQGRWHCQECAVCANCGSREPGGANSDRNSVAQWQHEYKKGEKNTRVYVSTLCVPCSK